MKNQLKKSLSFLMAVLMILSCWVWVAPDKAEAALSKYTFTVTWNSDNACNGGKANFTFYYPDGTNSSWSCSKMLSEDEGQGNGVTQSTDLDKWPNKISFELGDHGVRTAKIEITKLTINNHTIVSGGWTLDPGHWETQGRTWMVGNDAGTTGTVLKRDNSNVTASEKWDWPKPALALFNKIEATSPVAVNKLPNGGSATSTVTLSEGVDNYNVDWKGAYPDASKGVDYKFYYNDADGKPVDLKDYVSISGTKISINAKIQEIFPDPNQFDKDGNSKFNPEKTIYVDATYNKNKASTSIKITMPTYIASFYPNGGTIGTSASNNTKDDNSPIIYGDEEEERKLYYGSNIGEAPSYYYKEGMDFVGFYSVKNDDLTSKKEPDDYFRGVKFNGDGVPTTVGKLGEAYAGDTQWYAAWQASKIRATFVVNNQLLGTLEGRYNNSMIGVNGNMYGTEALLNEELYNNYTGDAIEFDDNYNPVLYIQGQKQVFDGWEIVDYDYNPDYIYNGDLTVILKDDVTFKAKFVPAGSVQSKYNVIFYSGNVNSNGVLSQLSNKNHAYRELIEMPKNEPTKAQNQQYTYEFIGWSEYIGTPFYAVDENSMDINGAYISYIPKETDQLVATKDVSYVPVFRMVPRNYTVTLITLGDNAVQNDNIVLEGCHYGDSITLPEDMKDNYTHNGRRFYIDGWKIGSSNVATDIENITVTGNMTLTASYDKTGILAEYTIRFYDMYGNLIGAEYDEAGNLTNESDYIHKHNTTVTQPTVGDEAEGDDTTYDIPQTIDTEDSLYTFKGWTPAFNSTASADVDYKAEYTKKDYADVYFCNYDGSLIYKLDGKENGFFANESTIPAYSNIVDGENVLPEREEDPAATYTFANTWKDGNGNVVTPGTDKFTGDIYLFAQFTETKKLYTVEFLNGDEVISRQKLEYGEKVTVPANPSKEADDYYTYSFKTWDKAVSEICYGNATYNATFRRTSIYYDVYWLNEYKDVENELRHSRYAYGTRIQAATAPAESVLKGEAEEGYTWGFSEWVRCDEAGNPLDANGNVTDEANALKFERGMTMPKETLYFYPTYELMPTMIEVEFYKEDGTTLLLLGKTSVPYEAAIDDYAGSFVADAAMASDETYHYDFNKWVKLDGSELPKLDDKYIVKEDNLKVKATYTKGSHNFTAIETILAPTCTETGVVVMKCNSDYCTLPEYEEIVPVVADNDAPTAQVYIGSNRWTMNQYNANEINYNEKVYVGANSVTIINAEDLGTRTKPWNNSMNLISRGVGKIEFYISEKVIADPATKISVWTPLYDYNEIYNQVLEEVLKDKGYTMDDYTDYTFGLSSTVRAEVDNEVKAIVATYNANATGILGDLGLENGKEYIIYFRLSDREVLTVPGDINISYLSTGRLHYGTQAATITVTGDGYGAKFCEEATIEVKDDTDGFEIYIDGVKQNISATTTSAAGTCSAKFTNNTTGVHTLTVVDKNGNKSTKTFEIKGGHSYRNYTVAATCENAGSNYNLCTVCGVRETVKVDPAHGHSFKDNFTVIAPTCVVNGSRVYVCDNNCGTKLTVGPASTAEELAQALIYDETTAAYRALTADDLKDLIATGEHTYAKVADEEGKDTDVDAWVIDKAATCSADGAKHRDCIKCGYRQSVEIKADGVSHKFYRARIEKGDEPTCTEKGIKSQTCRYCGIKENVDEIAALGHIAGEYRTVTAATCTAAGSKILTCGRCSTAETPVDIGEPVEAEDGTVTFDGKEVEIPALDHAWKTDGDPYKQTVGEGEEPDDKWYQDYVCDNDATHTKTEVTEYEEKQEATVTFMNGTDTVATVTKYVGESVSAADVTVVPTKAADATYKYTFSHWADAEGKEVKLPVTVAENGATYYAVFAEKNVKYTITYLNEDGSQYDKVGYLNNKAVVDLVDGPAKAETAYKTFTFAGWAEKVEKTVTEDIVDEEGNTTTIEKDVIEYVLVGDTVTIDGENVVLYARYTSKDRFYTVTYAMTMSDTIESISVRAGAKVRACAITPEKDGDSKYHYQFAGWNKANQLKAEITSNIYTTPNFTPVAHELTVIVVTPASCTANRVEKKVCACGYETEAAEVKNSALSHNWSETSDYDATTGKNIRKCQNVGCTATTTDTRTFSFNFFFEEPADANVKPDRDINNISWGTKVDASRLPADPTKNADDQYIYTFKGWKLKGDTDDKLQKIEDIVVKQDYDFVAVYDKVVREYKVTFAYEHSHKAIKTYTVEYGKGITFDGATPEKSKDTDPNYNADIYHYTFKGWSASTAEITKDITVYAKFERAEHTFGPKVEIEEANCQQGAGYTQTCTVATCKYVKETTGDPLDHVFELNDKGELQCTYIINGERCSEIKPVEDDGDDNETPVAEVKVIVTVYRDGAPARSIKVITQALGEDATKDASTNANGVATIVVESGKTYVAWVEIDGQKIEVPLATDSEGNFIGIYSIVTNNNSGDSDDDCGCACHRNNFWGTIFRFFHKIIKLITGEFKCCGNPDPMYG